MEGAQANEQHKRLMEQGIATEGQNTYEGDIDLWVLAVGCRQEWSGDGFVAVEPIELDGTGFWLGYCAPAETSENLLKCERTKKSRQCSCCRNVQVEWR